MKVLFVNEADVNALLPMRDCIGLMARRHRAAHGDAVLSPAAWCDCPTSGALA
jgi:hypothetical protein